jgi:3-oxoadipate enol-lactonase
MPLAYDDAGAGPAIAFLHAGIADRRMWEPQVGPFVDAGYRVVRCDLRGFGDSELRPGPLSNLADLEELFGVLAVDRVTLVGASYGGRVALEFTLAHPGRVPALVLVGAGLRDTDWSDEAQRAFEEEERLLEQGDVDAAVELNLRMWVDGPARAPGAVDPEVRRHVAEMQRRAFELQLAVPDAGPGEPFDPPASSRLGDVGCPTLVLVGDLDQPEILRVAEQLTGGVPEARKEVVSGAAHLPNLERPQEFNEVVLEFLSEALA